MPSTRMTVRRPGVAAMLLALLAASFVLWQGAQVAQGGQVRPISDLAPRGIVVVGDSITARYNDSPGDADQGWWSVVGRTFGADVTTYAQSGSGYLRPGHRCGGDRFINRSDVFAGEAPSILLVEGGRNDWARCLEGRLHPASNALLQREVDAYFDTLTTQLPASTRIVVVGPPWGPLQSAHGRRIAQLIAAEAEAHDLEFVDMTGVLDADRVHDGVHPNRAGSLAIARRVVRALDPRSAATAGHSS